MINVYRNGNQLVGVYQVLITNEQLLIITDIKQYLMDRLMVELKEGDSSELFSYKILKINECIESDLYGKKCGIAFEFVPNKELVEELQAVNERLQVGL